MKIDADLWVLGTLGACLLAAGGAVLRSAFSTTPPQGKLPASRPGVLDPDDIRAKPDTAAQAELAELREQLAAARAAHDAQRAEMVEQRQRAERQVQGAQAEIQRLSEELETEKARTQKSEDPARDLGHKLARDDGDPARQRGSAPSAEAASSAPADVSDLQKKLKAAADERDAARAKAEALERLIEGVRARSRQLADELRALKGE